MELLLETFDDSLGELLPVLFRTVSLSNTVERSFGWLWSVLEATGEVLPLVLLALSKDFWAADATVADVVEADLLRGGRLSLYEISAGVFRSISALW